MDHGTLTDNNGRKADFRNIILVMTTNAGAEESARRAADPCNLQRVDRRTRRSRPRSEEHTSELQSLMRISYAVFCLKKKKTKTPSSTRIKGLNNTNI